MKTKKPSQNENHPVDCDCDVCTSDSTVAQSEEQQLMEFEMSLLINKT